MRSMKSDSISGQERLERCGFLLGRLGKIVSRRFTKALEATGLKPPHAAVLMTLRDRGSKGPIEILWAVRRHGHYS